MSAFLTAAEREAQPCYVGFRPCGHPMMFCVDAPEVAMECAKEVAYCVRKGYAVKRMTVAESRLLQFSPRDCATCNPPKKNRGAP